MKNQRTDTPPRADGRNVDPGLGILEGEGAHQKVKRFTPHVEPARSVDTPGATTYYDQPVLKPTVWGWAIPAYLYVGGAAGATSALAAVAQTFGGGTFRGFARKARWVGTVGDAMSAALLIEDLGRPTRFLNMLRVFRPTSPMSVGTYVLAGSGALNTLSLLLAERKGLLGAAGMAGEYGSGLLGFGLSGYTAVLLANTTVPAWQAHRTMPPLFISSAMASAGSLFNLLELAPRERALTRRFGLVGQLGELAFAFALEREVGRSPEAARPFRHGFTGGLWRASKVLTAASLALTLLPGRARWKRRTAGVLGTLGSLALRFGVFYAGRRSATDPRATFGQQRRGYGANEVTGLSAVTGPEERALPHQKVERFRLPVVT